MLFFLARRVGSAVLVLLAVSFLTFTLSYLAPGDPAALTLGSQADPESLSRLRREYGLDKGFWAQYGTHLVRTLSGNFGYSYRYHGVKVGTLLGPTFPVTALLGLTAFVLSLLVGVSLGILSALRQGGWTDRLLVSLGSILSSVPIFVLALLALYLISLGGIRPIGDQNWAALVLSACPTFLFMRLTRASMLEVLAQDYIRAARARGIPPYRVVLRHGLANALTVLVPSSGVVAGALIMGTFFVERIFRIPGMAGFALNSVMARDYPVMLTVSLLFASIFVLANLLADIILALIDPRMRRGEWEPT